MSLRRRKKGIKRKKILAGKNCEVERHQSPVNEREIWWTAPYLRLEVTRTASILITPLQALTDYNRKRLCREKKNPGRAGHCSIKLSHHNWVFPSTGQRMVQVST